MIRETRTSRMCAALLALAVLGAACGTGGNQAGKSQPVGPGEQKTGDAPKAVVSTPAGAPGAPPVPAAPAAPAASPAAGAKPAPPPAASPIAKLPLERIGGTVSVLGPWGGGEQDSFLAMVKPFEDGTGVKVEYEGTRDLNAVLTTRVQGGNPPNVAALPGPGQMAEYARAGKLADLGGALDISTMRVQYAEDWLKLGSVDGKQVGIFMKAAVKGTIWYNAREFGKVSTGSPRTWGELKALSEKIAAGGTAPWCIGLASGAASGWPGTDWIENIVLRDAGPEKYDQWWQGTLAWSSPEVKRAWAAWGEIVGNEKMVYGGRQSMLSTNFGEAGNPLFSSPPRCYLHMQGSFITDFFVKANPNLKAGQDFDFMPFPAMKEGDSGTLEVAGDLVGMFRDSPQARAFIKYLASPEAQAVWIQRGGALSANKAVPQTAYPDDLARRQAQLLTQATTVRFDASDLMPEAMNSAFLKAILEYVQNPANLDSILANLDRVQKDTGRR